MCEATPRSTIALPSTARSVGEARRSIKRVVCAAHCSAVLSDALLLTSEAVTNAIVHGCAPITLTVDCTGHAIEIRVRDGHNALPALGRPSELDTNGRGLMLIDLVSNKWGVKTIGTGGKEVWFRLDYR